MSYIKIYAVIYAKIVVYPLHDVKNIAKHPCFKKKTKKQKINYFQLLMPKRFFM